MGMTTSYFAAAAIFSQVAGHNLLAPHALAARKRALLDFLDHGLDSSESEGPMTGRNFATFLLVIFAIAAVAYYFTTPRGTDIPLIGVVDGNEVIVSPQITGRIINLTVDEGSAVKKGDLIAELDSKELEANLAATKANVTSLEEQVNEANHNYTWTNEQTDASLIEAHARATYADAQLEPARAQLKRDQDDLRRMQKLFDKGEVSAQDRDHAEAAVRISQANVTALEASDEGRSGGGECGAGQSHTGGCTQERDFHHPRAARTGSRHAKRRWPRNWATRKFMRRSTESFRCAWRSREKWWLQGSPIVVVVDVDHLWVRADVEETYIDSIVIGQKLHVQLPSGDIIEGSVIFKGVENDFATQRDVSRTKRDIKTFAMKVAIPNPDRRLFTGMTATVLLPRPREQELVRAVVKRHGNGNRCNAIEVEHLVKKFGDLVAVNDISFNVRQREIFGLLGPNGAGKTTLIRMMTTLTPPTSGTRDYRGTRCAHGCGWRAQRHGRDSASADVRSGTDRAGKYADSRQALRRAARDSATN